MKSFSLIFIILLSTFIIKAEVVIAINYKGLTKTKDTYLNQLIQSSVGEEFDSLQLKKDEQILKNLNLFFSVSSKFKYNSVKKGYEIEFDILEAKYIYPVLAVEGFKTQLKLQLGLSNINWRGRNNTIGFLYQYYDRHSLSVYQKTPRHKNNKTGHEVSISKLSTVEPLYFDPIISNFNFDNYSISATGFYWLSNKTKINLGGMLMHEIYEQINENLVDLPMNKFNFNKYQIKSSVIYNGVNQHFEYFNGLKLKLYTETIQTQDYSNASFLKLIAEVKYFKRIGYKGNLALHYNFGVATNNQSPFSPFVLDGFINIRGVGNRVSRGTAQNILNIEYRYTLIDKKYFRIQSAIFTDIGSLRQAGDDIKTMFSSSELNYYSGLGIRLHSKYFYKTIFRIDYSVSLKDINAGGFTFGLGHFF